MKFFISFTGVDSATADSSHQMSALTTLEASARCTQTRHAHTRALRLETGYYETNPVTVLLLKPITGKIKDSKHLF